MANGYGMMEELIEMAREMLIGELPENCFTDDWKWSKSAFTFALMKDCGDSFEYVGNYNFYYDEDEDFYGTPEEQLKYWISNLYF